LYKSDTNEQKMHVMQTNSAAEQNHGFDRDNAGNLENPLYGGTNTPLEDLREGEDIEISFAEMENGLPPPPALRAKRLQRIASLGTEQGQVELAKKAAIDAFSNSAKDTKHVRRSVSRLRLLLYVLGFVAVVPTVLLLVLWQTQGFSQASDGQGGQQLLTRDGEEATIAPVNYWTNSSGCMTGANLEACGPQTPCFRGFVFEKAPLSHTARPQVLSPTHFACVCLNPGLTQRGVWGRHASKGVWGRHASKFAPGSLYTRAGRPRRGEPARTARRPHEEEHTLSFSGNLRSRLYFYVN
jgi:hypothetical protein